MMVYGDDDDADDDARPARCATAVVVTKKAENR
jgi:hypothetical protein